MAAGLTLATFVVIDVGYGIRFERQALGMIPFIALALVALDSFVRKRRLPWAYIAVGVLAVSAQLNSNATKCSFRVPSPSYTA